MGVHRGVSVRERKPCCYFGPGTVFTCHTDEKALLRVTLEHLLAGISKKGACSKVRLSSGMAGHPEASLSYPLG